MLLAWLGRRHGEPKASSAAEKMLAAVDRIVTADRHVTRDLGGTAGTRDMGDAIAEAAA